MKIRNEVSDWIFSFAPADKDKKTRKKFKKVYKELVSCDKQISMIIPYYIHAYVHTNVNACCMYGIDAYKHTYIHTHACVHAYVHVRTAKIPF
jgi:hypothetical protein